MVGGRRHPFAVWVEDTARMAGRTGFMATASELAPEAGTARLWRTTRVHMGVLLRSLRATVSSS